MGPEAFMTLVWRHGIRTHVDSPVLVRLPDGELRPVRSVVVRTIDGADTMMITVKSGGGPRA